MELSLGSLPKVVCPGACGFPRVSFPPWETIEVTR